MGVALVGVALIILFLLIYGFRLVQRNNRELWHRAYHDSLTGAKNFPYFNQELAKLADQVTEVVFGIPVIVKGEGK